MRKHFLILMLFALLPFSAWAVDDLTGLVDVAVGNVEYGQTDDPAIQVTFKSGGAQVSPSYYDIDGYYTTNDGTGDPIDLNSLSVGDTRYVKIAFKGVYSGFAYGVFEVKQATITLEVKNQDYFQMTYLGKKPNADTPLAAGDVVAKINNTTVTLANYVTVDYTKLNAYTFTGTTVATSGSAINFLPGTFTLVDAVNYKYEVAPRTMTINPATIIDGGLFTIKTNHHYNAKVPAESAQDNTYMYKAAGLNPTYEITWNYQDDANAENDMTLEVGTDFEFKFYDAELHEVTPTDAGNYTVKIFGMGNFTTPTDDNDTAEDLEDDTPNAGVAMDPFNIAKRPVTIKAIPQDKSYDGELVSTLFENVGWNVNGLQGADQSLGVTGLRIDPITEIGKNEGAYVTTVAWNEVAAQDAVPAQDAQKAKYEYSAENAESFAENKANLFTVTFAENGAAAYDAEKTYYTVDNEGIYTADLTVNELTALGTYYIVGVATSVAAADFNVDAKYYTFTDAQDAVPAQDAVEAQPAATVGEKPLEANYAPTARTSTWTITKKNLTVTIANKEMKKSDVALPNVTTGIAITAKSGYVTAEKAAIEAAFTTAFADADAHGVPEDEDYVPAEIMNGVTIETIEIKTYEGAIKATPNDAVLNNYNIAYEGGNLIVKGADFNLDPIVKSVMEYGDEYSITFDAYAGLAEATLNPATPVRYKVNGTEITNVTQLPKDLGTYVVEIIAGDYGSGDYKSGTITYGSASYVINPKKLTLTVNAQTVHTNDPVTVITGMEAVKGAEGTYTLDKNTVNDEALTMTFSLDETKVEIENNKIIGWKDDAVDHKAIKATIGETAIDAHYVVTVVAGELNISNEFFADLAAATAATTIAEADANGSEYNVTISGRKLNADTWNVMVLPFAVKPLDFCKAIDQYAVFNTLKSADNGNVKFGLCYDEIPANQPFLVKTKTAVDFDETYDDDENEETPEVKKYVIEGVTFVNAEPKQTNVSGAIFKGTYAATYAIPEPSYYAMQGGVFKHFTESLPLGFTRAYIVLTDATEARFFVEEADGTVTAISSINADGVAVPAEGWYTLNGVKLQAAPVEKGVYINNGKKVVIK